MARRDQFVRKLVQPRCNEDRAAAPGKLIKRVRQLSDLSAGFGYTLGVEFVVVQMPQRFDF